MPPIHLDRSSTPKVTINRARHKSLARCCPCTSHHVECGGLPPLYAVPACRDVLHAFANPMNRALTGGSLYRLVLFVDRSHRRTMLLRRLHVRSTHAAGCPILRCVKGGAFSGCLFPR